MPTACQAVVVLPSLAGFDAMRPTLPRPAGMCARPGAMRTNSRPQTAFAIHPSVSV